MCRRCRRGRRRLLGRRLGCLCRLAPPDHIQLGRHHIRFRLVRPCRGLARLCRCFDRCCLLGQHLPMCGRLLCGLCRLPFRLLLLRLCLRCPLGGHALRSLATRLCLCGGVFCGRHRSRCCSSPSLLASFPDLLLLSLRRLPCCISPRRGCISFVSALSRLLVAASVLAPLRCLSLPLDLSPGFFDIHRL